METRDPMWAARTLASVTKSVIVGLSGGKDSVAVLDLCVRHGLTVYAYTCTMIPGGLSFQRSYLDSLRARYRLPEILEVPHPDRLAYFRTGTYCRPQPDVPAWSHREVWDAARAHFGCDWVATGEKKLDSLQRRGMMSKWGLVQMARRRAFPVGDWNNADVFGYLRSRGVPLAPDYQMFGSSLSNPCEARYYLPIRERYPEDARRIQAVFPLVEAIAVREAARQEQEVP